jgi:manganese/zinc-transporting P-type ATPase C
MTNVVHTLPGRTRLHVKSTWTPTMIECYIRSFPFFHSAKYTKETQNVLIHHDPTVPLYTLQKLIQPLCTRIKEEKVQMFSWRKFVPSLSCGAMFLANWYIQSSRFNLLVKISIGQQTLLL